MAGMMPSTMLASKDVVRRVGDCELTRVNVERDGAAVMDAGKFLNLVNRCGLQLKELELARLTSRDLLIPWDGPGKSGGYTGLHLYVVAEYFRAVSPVRHPWSKEAATPKLEEVAALSTQVNRLLDAACGGGEVDDDEVEAFMVGVERCLARHDPFGPLGEVFDLLRPEVVAKMRNSGRLYLELKSAVSTLSRGLEAVDTQTPDPATRPLFGEEAEGTATTTSRDLRSTSIIGDRQPGGDEEAETSEAAQEAIDEVVQAAEQRESAPDDRRGEQEDSDRSGRTTQIIEVEPALDDDPQEVGDEESEPVVLLDEEVEALDDDADQGVGDKRESGGDDAGGFRRKAPMTKRTKALNERLQKLSENDRKRSESQETTTADGDDEKVAVPPPSPAERIDELNKRRQMYMKEQNWEKLVELYEEGIGLFSDPEERQQIFLVLAMLYEVKLRDKESAFEAFGRAWKVRRGSEQGRRKAWEGLQRLSKSAGLHEQYLSWLEGQLSVTMEPTLRKRVQKELALGLFADQQFERAFDSYASFVVENPERFVTEDTLSQLERLGEHVEEDKVVECFNVLRQAELEPAKWELVEEYAP